MPLLLRGGDLDDKLSRNCVNQVALAQQLDLPHVYLGYWIKASPKMVYKQHYRPLQMLDNGRWVPFRDDVTP